MLNLNHLMFTMMRHDLIEALLIIIINYDIIMCQILIKNSVFRPLYRMELHALSLPSVGRYSLGSI